MVFTIHSFGIFVLVFVEIKKMLALFVEGLSKLLFIFLRTKCNPENIKKSIKLQYLKQKKTKLHD